VLSTVVADLDSSDGAQRRYSRAISRGCFVLIEQTENADKQAGDNANC